jgi:hypothetical protein
MTVADCHYEGAPRPCPLVSCKFNNYLTPKENGNIILTWPDLQPEEVPPEHSCLLDEIARDGHSVSYPMSFRKMGERLGTTYQGAQRMVSDAQAHATASKKKLKLESSGEDKENDDT